MTAAKRTRTRRGVDDCEPRTRRDLGPVDADSAGLSTDVITAKIIDASSDNVRLISFDDEVVNLTWTKPTNSKKNVLYYEMHINGHLDRIGVALQCEQNKLVTEQVVIPIRGVEKGIDGVNVLVIDKPIHDVTEIALVINNSMSLLSPRIAAHSRHEQDNKGEAVSTAITGLVAILQALIGEPQTCWRIVQQATGTNSEVFIPQVSGLFLPRLKSLGPENSSLSIANIKILKLTGYSSLRTDVEGKVLDLASDIVKNANEGKLSDELTKEAKRFNYVTGSPQVLKELNTNYKEFVNGRRDFLHDLEKADAALFEANKDVVALHLGETDPHLGVMILDHVELMQDVLMLSIGATKIIAFAAVMTYKITAETVNISACAASDDSLAKDLCQQRKIWKDFLKNVTEDHRSFILAYDAEIKKLQLKLNQQGMARGNNVVERHTETITKIQQHYEEVLNKAMKEGRTALTTAMKDTVKGLSNKIDVALRSSQAFVEWQRPLVEALEHEGDKWTINYDRNKLQRWGPVVDEAYGNIAGAFEADLNQLPLGGGLPPQYISSTVRLLFTDQVTPTTKLTTVGYISLDQQIGETERTVVPERVVELDFMKDKLRNAKAIQVIHVTSTVTGLKDATSGKTINDVIEALDKETIKSHNHRALSYEEYSPIVSTHAGEYSSYVFPRPYETEVTEDVIPESVFTDTYDEPPQKLVSTTNNTVSVSTTTVMVTIFYNDPESPAYCIQIPVDPIPEDVARNLRGVQSASVSASDDKTTVEVVRTDSLRCSAGGLKGMILPHEFCVEDRYKLYDWLKELRRKKRVNNYNQKTLKDVTKGNRLTQAQMSYVEGGASIPFDEDLAEKVWTNKEIDRLFAYFENDGLPSIIQQLRKDDPAFSSEKFQTLMETEELHKGRNVAPGWFWPYVLKDGNDGTTTSQTETDPHRFVAAKSFITRGSSSGSSDIKFTT